MTRNHHRRQRRRDSESYTDMATVHESKADDFLHCATETQAEEPQLPEPTIVIMGMTGAGKSTFISHLTDDEVAVGHGLQSCTTEIDRYWVVRSTNGQRICLIDTPGFDDTNKTDEAVLFKIIAVLCSIYADPGLNICGLVYVHRITDTRMSGSSIKSVRTFEKLCGRDSFRHVTVVTSMWDHLDDSNQMIASERENSLQSNPDFFGNLMREGAETVRFYGNKKSAEEVIEHVLGRTQKVVMKIQKELADDKLCLNETEVGEFLLGENKADISKLRRDLQDLQEQLVEAEEGGDSDLMTTIMEEEKDVTELIRESELQKLGFGLNLEQLIEMLKDDQSDAPEQPISEGFEKTGKEESKTVLELELEEQMAKMEQDFVRQIQVLKKEKRDQSDEIKLLRMQREKWIYEFDNQLRNAKAGKLAKNVGRVRMERRGVLAETMRMVKAALPSWEPAPPPAGRNRDSPRIGSLKSLQQPDDDSCLLQKSHEGAQGSLTRDRHLYEKDPQQQVAPQRTQSLDSISQRRNTVNNWPRFSKSSSTANMLENTKFSSLRRKYD